MKTTITVLLMLVLVSASGCFLSGNQDSPQGGIMPMDEEFSITVPSFNTVMQGSTTSVAISLNRGAYFKRDVQMVIKTNGIYVTPNNFTIKANESPNVQLLIVATRESAIGEYRVDVKGTPETGRTASTGFTVKVTAQAVSGQ